MTMTTTDAQDRVIAFVDSRCSRVAHRFWDNGDLKLAGVGANGRPQLRLRVAPSGEYNIEWDYEGVMQDYDG